MKKILITYFTIFIIFLLLRNITNEYIKISLAILLMILFNIQCSIYLYKNSKKYKIIWAIMGFFGNIATVLIHWTYNFFKRKWEKGESVFGNQVNK
jgi:hypothetical protein